MADAASTNIHIEMMYGKSKDVCAVINIPSDALSALVHGTKSDAIGNDQVVATGAYFDPALPSPSTSGATACHGQTDARACLRSLAALNAGPAKIRMFPGYLPSVLNAIEQAYGASQAQQLVIPTSGAIQYRITLVGTMVLPI